MQELDFLNDQNLIFVDIEATDDKEDRKIIQLSGIKYNTEQKNVDELDLIFNPEQTLSNHIINLLKTDNETLSQYPTFNDEKTNIINFLSNSTIITFGDFDINILKKYLSEYVEYNIQWFDFQKYLKSFCHYNIPLAQMHYLIMDDVHMQYQHNALYDAEMLKNVFYKIKNLETTEELKRLCLLSHLMPREVIPKHRIFVKNDFINKWTNNLSDRSPIVINNIEIDSILIKNYDLKQKVYYLKKLEGYIVSTKKTFGFHTSYVVSGIYTYSHYLDEIKSYINNFLEKNQDRGIIFYNVSKEKINQFIEIIYDSTKRYSALNYVNISVLKKNQKNSNDLLTIFNEILDKEDPKIQNKLRGFYKPKSSYK